MAKENKKIISAVRYKGTVYKEGMEDELASSGADLKRLADKGAISGFDTKSKAKEEAPTEPVAPESSEEPEAEAIEVEAPKSKKKK